MKTLALTLILALAATQAQAWKGIYRGKQARAYYYNPYATRGVYIAGAGHPSSPRYYRGSYRRYGPVRGGGRVYGTSGDSIMDSYYQLRQIHALEDIAAEMRWGDLK